MRGCQGGKGKEEEEEERREGGKEVEGTVAAAGGGADGGSTYYGVRPPHCLASFGILPWQVWPSRSALLLLAWQPR